MIDVWQIKKINGNQCTITLHVEQILQKLNDKFGKNSPLMITRGKVLEYLGMTIEYRLRVKV